jgi:ATP-dependent DNA helicase UvrD/PcrA
MSIQTHSEIEGSKVELTPDQQRAVEYDAGPVIVLAGPGTGKTRVITARVAHMIQERGVNPEQIVAVTFTNKAAGELGDRLGGLVGTTIAARVVSSTFHSLGLGMVRRFGDVLGVPSDPMLIDSSQRKQLIREIIREHKLYRYAMGSGIDSAIELAMKTMSELRNLSMHSDDALAWVQSQRDALESLERAEAQARGAELDRFEQAAMVYGHFESQCLDRGWMDFDDLILLPIRLMREHPQIAAILRHDHRHVVVDEFQDVNAAQIEMIRQLCPPNTNPDLCVVGDDDQSIYGFRGADDRAFAHFAGIWEGSPTITLSTNFRSAGPIVAASNAVIEGAHVRFDPDKVAVSHAGEVDGAGIELIRLEDDKQSGEAIASMLLKMVSEAKEGDEAFDFGSCAVIARTGAELERIARVLTLEGIPVEIRQKRSPMDDEGVLDVLAWARVLGDPGLSVDVKRVLIRPPYRCDAIVLGRLVARWKAIESQHLAGDPQASDPGDLIGWLVEHSDEPMRAKIEKMRVLLAELGVVAGEADAGTALMEIIKRTGVVQSELSDGHGRASRVAALVEVVRFARLRKDRFESPGDLGAMLRYIEDLSPGEKSLGELPEDAVEQTSDLTGDSTGTDSGHAQGAVAMLTAHASKGLEFETVFIPRVSPQFGYPKTNNPGGDEEVLPEGLIDRAGDVRDAKARMIDEERRVFYVALTRAHHRAVLLAKVPKKTTVTNFVYELRASDGVELPERDAFDVLDPSMVGDAVSDLGVEFKSANRIRDVFDQAKRDARRDAAMAIDAMEMGELVRTALDIRLRHAANRIALVNEVYITGEVPQWVAECDDPELGKLACGLVDALAQKAVASEQLHPGLKGPLKLSFSQISKYLQCPRCYLVNYVLRLPEDEQVVMMLGTVIHEALEEFYIRWRDADAEGLDHPGLGELEAMTRKYYFKHQPRDAEVDEGSLEKAMGMIGLFWEQMHDEQAHIIELEREHVFGYVCDGIEHKIKAKIDRVDATAEGGSRVIDYKTGYPRKELTEPKKDNLQLGIYAMAIEHELGELGPGSVCEYWLLADGTRGVIGTDDLDMSKIRKRIDKAIAGMLEGDWTQSNKCKRGEGGSACSILDASDVLGVFGSGDE